jgi:RHS repeat-associated protein
VAQTVGGVTTEYVLDVAGGLPEVIVAATGGASTRYVQVQGQVLAQQDSGVWTYVLPDHLGSVRQLVGSDSQVALVQSFDPFGVPFESAGSGASEFGYTGEWWDADAELLYLRARYCEPVVGRFIAKDLFSGFVNTPQSLNRWVYVESNPVNRTDPTGLWSPYCQTGRCGPSIDAWFLEEINIHWNWVAAEKAAFDQVTSILEERYNDPISRELSRSERHGEWVLIMRDYWKAIPHKWMRFSHLVPGCPSMTGCQDAITLCNTCLERSELGNLLFGLTAKVAGLSNKLTYTGGHDIAKGLQKPWDQAVAGVGYYVAEQGQRLSDTDTMCRAFQSSSGVWQRLPTSRGPAPAPWNWSLVQDDRIKGCKPCKQAVPVSTPHTVPAFAGEPVASDRIFAGAPNYEYFDEQIPEGMLDPRLYRRFPSRVPRHP